MLQCLSSLVLYSCSVGKIWIISSQSYLLAHLIHFLYSSLSVCCILLLKPFKQHMFHVFQRCHLTLMTTPKTKDQPSTGAYTLVLVGGGLDSSPIQLLLVHSLQQAVWALPYDNSNVRDSGAFDAQYHLKLTDSLLLSFPQIEIGTLAPPDYNYPVPEASLEEQVEEEEEVEEELPLTPQLIPQGSGGSGVLMGPETQKGLKKHTPICIETFDNQGSLGLREGPVPPWGLWSSKSTQKNIQSKDRLIYSLNPLSASSTIIFSMCMCSI